MDNYIVKASEIAALQGEKKTHFLNPNAVRENKSLGDLTGLTGLGFHIITVAPGHETTEFHVHQYEDECVYILAGEATAHIGDETFAVSAGDFIGYRAGGLAHTLINTGEAELQCIVVGQRLAHDVSDYPRLGQRLYRNRGQAMNLVSHDNIIDPNSPPE